MDLRFRVQGQAFIDVGLGLRIKGVRFRVKGQGFRVWALGSGV
jgi:hypothetical protein